MTGKQYRGWNRNCSLYPQIGSYLRGQTFVVVFVTIVDVIECTHSIPYCTAIMSEQPMYAQQLSEFAHSFSFTPSSEQY